MNAFAAAATALAQSAALPTDAVRPVEPAAAAPRPRLVSLPAPGSKGFGAVLAELAGRPAVPVEPEEPVGGAAPIPLAQLMDMLTILMMLGAPVPTWMIDALRAAGFTTMAVSLTERNRRLERGAAA